MLRRLFFWGTIEDLFLLFLTIFALEFCGNVHFFIALWNRRSSIPILMQTYFTITHKKPCRCKILLDFLWIIGREHGCKNSCPACKHECPLENLHLRSSSLVRRWVPISNWFQTSKLSQEHAMKEHICPNSGSRSKPMIAPLKMLGPHMSTTAVGFRHLVPGMPVWIDLVLNVR